MYSVDHRDRVVPLAGVPGADPGATSPLVLADELTVALSYNLSVLATKTAVDQGLLRQHEQAGSPRVTAFAVVAFQHVHMHLFGPPNDEAIRAHPLFARGLTANDAFEVLESSWIREMERRNRVHESHDAARFDGLRHFIFSFHDSTFECVCREFKVQMHWHAATPVISALTEALGIQLPMVAPDDPTQVARRAARARELEQSFGLSAEPCIWKDCPHFALRGIAICAEHYDVAGGRARN